MLARSKLGSIEGKISEAQIMILVMKTLRRLLMKKEIIEN